MRKKYAELVTKLGGELNTLLVASRAVMASSAARFHPSLPPAAYQIAVTLSGYGSARASGLADTLGMDKSAVSRLAKSLGDKGLVEALVDPDDGRGVIYSLTDEGRHRIQVASSVKSDAFFSRVEGWSDAELVRFIALLKKFNQTEKPRRARKS
jgi:DNA-binding MarR family transcriptional regulator